MALPRRRYKVYGREVASAVMDDGMLDIPSGFLGERTLPLWFHPNYRLLEAYLEAAMAIPQERPIGKRKHWTRKTAKQFHVVGTPGIGKSYFGHYWFYKQAKLRNKVIWRTTGDRPLFVYYNFALGEPLVGVSLDYEVPLGWNEEELLDVWMIIDGESKGVEFDGPILHCVSGRSGHREFAKDTGLVYHLEAWTLEDLRACRDGIELDLDDEQLEKRFCICGGLPRLIFDAVLYSTADLETMTLESRLAGETV